MYNILAIGDPIVDTHIQLADNTAECSLEKNGITKICLDYGAKIPIIDSFQDLGGNAANVAVAATKLGLKTSLIATIGDDSNGRITLELLKKYKVDTDLVTTEAGSDTRYSMILNYKSERTILSYSEKKNYVWPEPIPPTDWIYYTGLSEGFEAVQNKLVEHLAARATVRLIVNPGSYVLKYGLKQLREIIAKTDILIVNLEEAEKIIGKKIEQEKTEAALIHELIGLGAKEVALTDGSRGAWAGNEEEIWFLEPYPVKAVAKTGAGDAFAAAYVAARHDNHDIPHALEWGTANSAGVIRQHGPHAGLLDKNGISKIIEANPTIEPIKI